MDLEANKEKIIELLWKSVNRFGIIRLVDWLQESDFFTAPASTNGHLAELGGLAQHSLLVYKLLADKIKYYITNSQKPDITAKIKQLLDTIDDESVIVCALAHDFCKINFYSTENKNVKNPDTGKWETKLAYVIKDQFPYGHGEKSVSILQAFINVTPRERLAIRWHMGPFEPNVMFFGHQQTYQQAMKDPLTVLLYTSDLEASKILEG